MEVTTTGQGPVEVTSGGHDVIQRLDSLVLGTQYSSSDNLADKEIYVFDLLTYFISFYGWIRYIISSYTYIRSRDS